MKYCVHRLFGISLKVKWLIFLVVVLLVGCAAELSAEEQHQAFSQPVLITPPGQNADGLMVKVIMHKLGIDCQYLPLANAKDLNSVNSVIMTVGISNKGLGALGISYEEEYKRTVALVSACLEKKCSIICVYLGGKASCGTKSDQLIHEVASYASYLIITKGSEKEQYLTELAQQNQIPLKIVGKICEIEGLLKELYGSQN